MKRIQNISYGLATLVLINVVSIVLLSLAMGRTNRTLSSVNGDNVVLRSEIEKTNLPIRVFGNIAGQTIDTPEKRALLQEAYVENMAVAKESVTAIHNTTEALESLYNELKALPTATEEIDHLLTMIEEIYTQNHELKTIITAMERRGALGDKESVAEALSNYNRLVNRFSAYQRAFLDSTVVISNKQIILLDGLIVFLVLTIIALLVLLLRITNKDLFVLKKTYAQIKNRAFDDKDIWSVAPYFTEEKEIYDIVTNYFADERLIQQFSELVNRQYVMDEIIDHLLENTQNTIGADRVGIAFYDSSRRVLTAEYGAANYDTLYLNIGYSTILKNTSLEKVVTSRQGFIDNDVLATFEKKPNSHTLTLLVKEGIRANMAIPLVMNDDVFGIVFFSSLQQGHFTGEHYALGKQLIYEITGALNRSYLMKVFMNRITMAFARLVDKKDIETGEHLNRMVRYSVAIAESLKEMNRASHKVDQKMIFDIERNAAVHDIGKVATPDYILKKPGRLTEEEFEIMKEHTTVGAEIFRNLNEELSTFSRRFFGVAETIVRSHHERWDGSGYPDGLSGEAIPLVARIVALGDVFDALTSKRIYKKAMSFNDSVALIASEAGKQFDPVVVEAFINDLKKIRTIYDASQEKG